MKKIDKNSLDSDHVCRLLFIFTLPAFFAMAVHTLYNVVDTIFIGQYVGPYAIAALSLVFPVQILSIGIGHMAGMGGASLISRSLGAGKIQQAEKAVGNSIMITAVLSILVTIPGLINVPLLCRWLGATDNTIVYASDYLFVILIGMLFMTFGMTLSTLIRAGGNARVPMIGMVCSAALNIVLDAIFIITFGMGVKGAAWATVISQVLCTIYFLGYYFWGKPALSFKLADLWPDWKIIKDIFAIGVSALGMTLAGSFSAIIVNRTVVSYGGDMAMSAYGIVNRVMMFAIMPSIVAAQGLQPIIGFNYGAGRFDRVIKSIKIGTFATTLIGVLVYLYVFFKPESVVMIFTADRELIDIASYAVKRVFCVMYLIGLINVGATVFQSIGKAVQSFLSTVTRSILFLLPAILIMPGFMGLDGVWWAFPIADLLTFALVLFMLAPLWFELKRLNSAAKAVSSEPLVPDSIEGSSQAVA
ncbi:MAG: MATE family efflux transporter [Desulfatiglans sp.]|nr:MATE family efflux transporter [Desulfatiglans sp.]